MHGHPYGGGVSVQVHQRLRPTALSPAWMARSLGVLYICGGSLALLWTTIPVDGHAG